MEYGEEIRMENSNIFSIFSELETITKSDEKPSMKNSLAISAFFKYIKDNYIINTGHAEVEQIKNNIRVARDKKILLDKFPEFRLAFEQSISGIFSRNNIKIYSEDELHLFEKFFQDRPPLLDQKPMLLRLNKPKKKKIKKKNLENQNPDDNILMRPGIEAIGTWGKQKLSRRLVDEVNYISSQPKPIIQLVQLSIQLEPPAPYYQVKLKLQFNKNKNFRNFSCLLSPAEGSEDRFSRKRKNYYYYCDLSERGRFKLFLEKISKIEPSIAEIAADILTEFDPAQQQEIKKENVNENNVMAKEVKIPILSEQTIERPPSISLWVPGIKNAIRLKCMLWNLSPTLLEKNIKQDQSFKKPRPPVKKNSK